MLSDQESTGDLLRELDRASEVIGILEQASQELRVIIDWDESIRQNSWRHKQLQSILQQLASERAKQKSLALRIEKLQALAVMGAGRAKFEGRRRESPQQASPGR
jgi:hypothetical protein